MIRSRCLLLAFHNREIFVKSNLPIFQKLIKNEKNSKNTENHSAMKPNSINFH